MVRRLALFVLAVCAILAVFAGALTIWRVPIAQFAVDWAIRQFEVPSGRATVTRVAWADLALAGLAAGDETELSVDSVDVEYRPPGLFQGRVDGLVIEGLRLSLDLRDGAEPLGSLQSLVDRFGEDAESDIERYEQGDERRFPLPDLRLNDGRVEAQTDYGPASLAVEGNLAGGRTGDPMLSLRGDLTSAPARLTADLSASGDLQEQAEARLDLSDGAVALPDGSLELSDLAGSVQLSLEAGRPSAGQGEITARHLVVAGRPFAEPRASFDLDRQRADLTAHLGSADGSFDLALDGRADGLDSRPKLDLELQAEIGETAPVWSFSRPPFPRGGEGRVAVAAGATFAAPPPAEDGREALTAWLESGDLSGTATASFTRLLLPESAAEAAADLDLAVDWQDGALSLTTRRDNSLSATGLAASDLAPLGLPEELAEKLVEIAGGTVSLAIPAPDEQPSVLVWRPKESGLEAQEAQKAQMAQEAQDTQNFQSSPGADFDGSIVATAGPVSARATGTVETTLGPDPALVRADLPAIALSAKSVALDGYRIENLQATGRFAGDPLSFEAAGELDGRLVLTDLNGVSASALSFRLPFDAAREDRSFDLSLAGPGTLKVDGLTVARSVKSEGPIEVALAESDAKLVLEDGTEVFALAYKTRARLGETRLLLGPDDTPVPLRVEAPDIALTGDRSADGDVLGTARLRKAALALPSYQLAFDDISVDLTLPGAIDGSAADLTVGAIRHLAEPAAVAPLRFSGRAHGEKESVKATGRFSLPGGQDLADLEARYEPKSGSGQADLTLRTLSLTPGGLQPAALSPLLADVTNAHGQVNGSVAVQWQESGFRGEALVTLDDMSFDTTDARVSGLDLSLALDSLQPPTSPPHQTLRAASVDLGVPITDLEARFRLPPGPNWRILIEDASFTTIGSRFAVRETLIDPADERLDANLYVEEMNIAVLFELLAVEGLSGSGELAGVIPIQREGTSVTIENARLDGLGPGVLKFRSDAARRALAAGGQPVELVVQALEDFRYETLSLSGDLHRDGDANLRLEILGHNPEVLDGHPFQLNINLTGNSTQILNAITLGRALFGEIMQRARRLSL